MNGNYYPGDGDRQAIEEALKESDQPLTMEAIELNPWHAVARELARDASTELAAAVVHVTDDLGECATKWGNRADDAEERQAWHDLAELTQIRGENAALAHERTTARVEPEIARAEPAETLTLEAIRQEPWNAVNLEVPKDASMELLGNVAHTAWQLRSGAEERARAAGSPEDREHWQELAGAAADRFDEVVLKHFEARLQEAWQAPSFSRATIDTDPWTAVHLPIPEQAEPALLADARNWASDLGRFAQGNGALAEPALNTQSFTREENIAAAAERVEAIDVRLSLTRERMEERHRDELELVHDAYGVEELPSRLSRLEHRQAGERAQLEEIIAGAQREARPELEESRWHGEFLSGLLIASRMGVSLARTTETLLGAVLGYFVDEPEMAPERFANRMGASLARTTEMLLGAVLGYFVDEPELTPEQSRLAARANAERGEAMEFEMARRENAAALDRVNEEINRHRPHVRPEEPVRPDSIYERYPGLTREDDGGRGREAEAERAFYDTGIERSRSRAM
jgi:hypothetical protein